MIRNLSIIHNIKYLNALRRLPASQRNVLFGIIKIYQQLDREVRRFKNSTELDCLFGCGQCCESSKVESTIIEAMPLAVELHRLKQIGQWDSNFLLSQQDNCIFYRPSNNAGSGRCTVYVFRPLACRLFGFSAAQDKYGYNLFNTCSNIKKISSQLFQKAQLFINHGLSIPKMKDYSMRIFNLDPYLSRERFPVMEAISKAFDRIAFLCEYKKGNSKYSFNSGRPLKFTKLSSKMA